MRTIYRRRAPEKHQRVPDGIRTSLQLNAAAQRTGLNNGARPQVDDIQSLIPPFVRATHLSYRFIYQRHFTGFL